MIAGLDFRSFQAWRRDRLMDGFSGWDAGDADLYGALARFDDRRFGPLVADLSPRAGHRCHVAEAFLDWLGLERDLKSRTLISHGVRHSLGLLMACDERWWVPDDVYPVYRSLAAEAGVDLITYAARDGVEALLGSWDGTGRLLVCDPLKPWGGVLSAADRGRLLARAEQGSGTLVVDVAYDLTRMTVWAESVRAGRPVLALGSLSKGWLAPQCAGLVLGGAISESDRSTFQAADVDRGRLRTGYGALVEDPQRPNRVHTQIQRWRTAGLMRAMGLGIPATGDSYFLISPRDPDLLWSGGVLAMPASVFGGRTGSVLSVLPGDLLI